MLPPQPAVLVFGGDGMSDRFVHTSGEKFDVIELRLPHHLDFNEFDRIIDSLSHIIESRPAARWIIDLSHVEYTGSAVLGLLVNLRQQIKEGGGSLVLCGMSEKLGNILRACSLDRLFKHAATRDAAMRV
jgi:anti-anti-sigma factor